MFLSTKHGIFILKYNSSYSNISIKIWPLHTTKYTSPNPPPQKKTKNKEQKSKPIKQSLYCYHVYLLKKLFGKYIKISGIEHKYKIFTIVAAKSNQIHLVNSSSKRSFTFKNK